MNNAKKIVLYRKNINEALHMVQTVKDCVDKLLDITVPVPEVMRKRANKVLLIDNTIVEPHSEDYQYADYRWYEDDPFPETSKVFSKDFFNVLFYDTGTCLSNISNLFYYLDDFRNGSKTIRDSVEPFSVMTPPNLDGWDDVEIAMIIEGHQNTLDSIKEFLRDTNTRMKYLRNSKVLINPIFKPGLTNDFFGQSDFAVPYIYRDVEFYTGSYNPHRNGVSLINGKFWYPVVGIEVAYQIENLFDHIAYVTKPREGEPETLDYFGSNRTNRIKTPLF